MNAFRPIIETMEPRRLLSAALSTATARWDTVPGQTFSATLDAGVVAFEAGGISHVDFSVNGGAPFSVTKMTLNPQTNVWEYVLPLLASAYADGAIQVGATAYPVSPAIAPRVLAPITLYADAGGTLPSQVLWVSPLGSDANAGNIAAPFRSIERATEAAAPGAVIDLAAGTYPFDARGIGWNENDRWITLQPAPSVPQSNVIIQPNGAALRVYHLAMEGVTIHATVGADITGWNYVDNTPDAVWLDNCDVSSPGITAGTEINQVIDQTWTHSYVTNTTIHDYAGRGIVNSELVRNVKMYNLGDDAIDVPGLVVNSAIDNVVAINAAEHIDAIQWWNPSGDAAGLDSNSIVYNVTATRVDGQLLFGGDNNVAVVNFLGVSLQGAASPAASQWGGAALDNAWFDHVTLPNQSLLFNSDVYPLTNTALTNSEVWRLSTTSPAISVANDWIQDVSAFGPVAGQYGTGDPQLAADGTPAPGSPLTPLGIGYSTGVTPVPPPPVIPPLWGTSTAATITRSGRQAELITVTYSDVGGISIQSIGTGDVLVTGPHGYSVIAKLVGVTADSATQATAVYRITAAGGWRRSIDGTYYVHLLSTQVFDAVGNPGAAQLLGTFSVKV